MTGQKGVLVAGIGSTSYGKAPGGLRSLAAEASSAALQDAGLASTDIEALYVGAFSPGTFAAQEHVAPLVAEEAGVLGVPAARLEAACASGSLAIVAGAMAIMSGVYRVVLVVGVEKMTNRSAGVAGGYLALAGDSEREGRIGLPFPGVFALIANRHAYEYGTLREHLDAVAIKAHENALHNPKAQFHRSITADDIRSARIICSPLTMYDCAPISDGASAVILTADDVSTLRPDRVTIMGIGQASDTLSFVDRTSLTSFPASRIAADRAYGWAGIGPADVDIAEVHDCFTIAEIIATEDLGFFVPGEAASAVVEGRTGVKGEIPINPSGGLKGKGHPVGATGVGQIVELTFRLRGGDPRVPHPVIGLAHNLGGSGATATVTILAREG